MAKTASTITLKIEPGIFNQRLRCFECLFPSIATALFDTIPLS
jgi:hypothetical protein